MGKQIIIPVVTTAERNAFTPTTLTNTVILNTSLNLFQIFNGVSWDNVNAGTASPPSGDPDTIAVFNGAGTFTDDLNFVWKISSGRFGIGNPAPQTRIHVKDEEGTVSVGTLQPNGVILGRTHPTANLGDYSVVLGGVNGGQNSAVGDQAFSGGELCQASAQQAFAFGQGNIASAQMSVAFGLNNTASGQQSFVCGNDVLASGYLASGLGQGSTAQGFLQFVIGRNNVLQGTAGSSVAGDDAFIIGNGTSTGSRANAFSVSNDGKVRTGREVYVPDTTQVLGAVFTVAPNKSYCPVSSAGVVTSSGVTAISDGSETGQLLIIENQGANNIILQNAANTKLPGAANFTLTPNSIISLIWNGTDWICQNTSAN